MAGLYLYYFRKKSNNNLYLYKYHCFTKREGHYIANAKC